MEISLLIKFLARLIQHLRITSPIPTLRKAKEQKSWFYGIVMATTFFEIFGLERLKENFKGKISGKRLENLGLEQIILLLHGCGIIDQKTYTKMMEVRKVRNKVVHSPFDYEIKDTDARKIIEKAIDCLKSLGLPDQKTSEIPELEEI